MRVTRLLFWRENGEAAGKRIRLTGEREQTGEEKKSTKEIGEFARSWLALLLLMWWLLKEPFVR